MKCSRLIAFWCVMAMVLSMSSNIFAAVPTQNNYLVPDLGSPLTYSENFDSMGGPITAGSGWSAAPTNAFYEVSDFNGSNVLKLGKTSRNETNAAVINLPTNATSKGIVTTDSLFKDNSCLSFKIAYFNDGVSSGSNSSEYSSFRIQNTSSQNLLALNFASFEGLTSSDKRVRLELQTMAADAANKKYIINSNIKCGRDALKTVEWFDIQIYFDRDGENYRVIVNGQPFIPTQDFQGNAVNMRGENNEWFPMNAGRKAEPGAFVYYDYYTYAGKRNYIMLDDLAVTPIGDAHSINPVIRPIIKTAAGSTTIKAGNTVKMDLRAYDLTATVDTCAWLYSTDGGGIWNDIPGATAQGAVVPDGTNKIKATVIAANESGLKSISHTIESDVIAFQIDSLSFTPSTIIAGTTIKANVTYVGFPSTVTYTWEYHVGNNFWLTGDDVDSDTFTVPNGTDKVRVTVYAETPDGKNDLKTYQANVTPFILNSIDIFEVTTRNSSAIYPGALVSSSPKYASGSNQVANADEVWEYSTDSSEPSIPFTSKVPSNAKSIKVTYTATNLNGVSTSKSVTRKVRNIDEQILDTKYYMNFEPSGSINASSVGTTIENDIKNDQHGWIGNFGGNYFKETIQGSYAANQNANVNVGGSSLTGLNGVSARDNFLRISRETWAYWSPTDRMKTSIARLNIKENAAAYGPADLTNFLNGNVAVGFRTLFHVFPDGATDTYNYVREDYKSYIALADSEGKPFARLQFGFKDVVVSASGANNGSYNVTMSLVTLKSDGTVENTYLLSDAKVDVLQKWFDVTVYTRQEDNKFKFVLNGEPVLVDGQEWIAAPSVKGIGTIEINTPLGGRYQTALLDDVFVSSYGKEVKPILYDGDPANGGIVFDGTAPITSSKVYAFADFSAGGIKPPQDGNATIMLALYTDGGVLSKLVMASDTGIDSINKTTLKVSMDVTAVTSGYFKAFVWNNIGELQPLSATSQKIPAK